MNSLLLSMFFLALIIGVIAGFAAAAARGYTVPPAICFAVILAGAVLVGAPLVFSFLLQALGRQPQFTKDERITCWMGGSVMVLLGIIAAVFSRRSGGGMPK